MALTTQQLKERNKILTFGELMERINKQNFNPNKQACIGFIDLDVPTPDNSIIIGTTTMPTHNGMKAVNVIIKQW